MIASWKVVIADKTVLLEIRPVRGIKKVTYKGQARLDGSDEILASIPGYEDEAKAYRAIYQEALAVLTKEDSKDGNG
jgi:hypothetical protein